MNTKEKKLHVIGLCGSGTSATAVLMRELGWEISGSDAGMYEPIASYITSQNLICKTPYAPDNIPDDVDMILMGSSATLNPQTNAEVARAYDMGVPVKSFAEILSDITEQQKQHNIVIAGSYGKSTSTALLTHYLIDAGKDPSYFIGALPFGFSQTSHIGSGDYFILEGDEYPHKSDDMTSKFMFYHARSVLLTSGEHDHVNKFPTPESYLATYKKLLTSLPQDAVLVCAIEHPGVREIISHSPIPAISYGFDNADYTARNIHYGEISSFNIFHHNISIGRFETQLLGRHNIENILGTVALALETQALSVAELQKATRTFRGLHRRLDKKTHTSYVPVYEGFGSSYTKAKTAIEAIKLHFPERKLITVFEPHTFGWRNRNNLPWYDDVFDGSEMVLIYKPPMHGADSHEQLSHAEIIERVAQTQSNVFPVASSEEAITLFQKELDNNSIILLLSSGDLGGMVKTIPEFCDQHFSE